MGTIGENIAKMRKRTSLTQEELAEKMNVSGQAVSKWENDVSYPDVETLGRLAKLFGCTMDELINGIADAPQVKSAEPEKVDKRILVISVNDHTEGDKVNLRFPVSLVKRAFMSDSLESLVGDNAEPVKMAMGMINEGVTGEILNIESSDADVIIKVVDYEG